MYITYACHLQQCPVAPRCSQPCSRIRALIGRELDRDLRHPALLQFATAMDAPRRMFQLFVVQGLWPGCRTGLTTGLLSPGTTTK